MRRIAWFLLLLLSFAIPWEYSMELGEPLGNIARILGLLLLLVAIPAILQAGRIRTPGPMQWLVLALYFWFCCTYFWTIEPLATQARMRGYFQEMMIVWLVWEFAESAGDLRALMRAYVAGAWVLALLTMASYATAEGVAEQVRFVAAGQDPNDVARFLNLGFPLAALMVNSEPRWQWRLLAAGYLPLGLVAVLLTASRGGFLAAVVVLGGSGVLLAYGHAKRILAGALALPPLAALLWWIIPSGSFERLATINEQLQGGGLNMRWNIWIAGWHAFVRAPVFGTGAGSFASTAGLSPLDTAHNTALSIAVSGGLVALFLATAIVAVAIWSITQTHGPLRWAMALALLVLGITSLVATVEENRTTWLLLAMIALAGRLGAEEPERVASAFEPPSPEGINNY
jgi:O-antigen ligase